LLEKYNELGELKCEPSRQQWNRESSDIKPGQNSDATHQQVEFIVKENLMFSNERTHSDEFPRFLPSKSTKKMQRREI
jgi:hypothetical protein